MKNKILIIENSIHLTGDLKSITRSSFDLSNHFEFLFVIPKHSKGRFWIENKGFSKIFELPMRELSRRLSSLVLYVPFLVLNSIRLKKILKTNNVDIIHINDVYNLLPVAIRLFGNSTPYVCHFRFLPDRFPALLLKFWLMLHFRFASKIVAVSENVRRQLPNHPKVIVIHNELPAEERYPNISNDHSEKASYGFLYLSNFMEGKGQALALKAFSRIHHQLSNWTLRFVGGDMGLAKNRKYREGLRELGKELGIDQKLEWCDFADDVELEYKKADIVLNFSESESFSITCLEAMFYGRPLIASDCGGPSEIVSHMTTGLIVENRNVAEMSEAMLSLATNPKLRLTLAKNAREQVRDKFSISNTSYILKDVYNESRLKTR